MSETAYPRGPPAYLPSNSGQVPYDFKINPSNPSAPPPKYNHYEPSNPPQPEYPQGQYYPPPVQTIPSVSYPTTTNIINMQPQGNNSTVVLVGGCPSCRVGTLKEEYTCCGICCAIFCFPIGILCCLCMKEKRCSNCRASF